MPSRRDVLLLFHNRRTSGKAAAKVELRSLAYFGVMLVLIGLAGGLYLHQSSKVAEYARDIRVLEAKKEDLRRGIVSQRAQIAMLGSLDRITRVAHELGYELPPSNSKGQHLWATYPAEAPASSEFLAATQDTGPDSGPAPRKASMFEKMVEQFSNWMSEPVTEKTTR